MASTRNIINGLKKGCARAGYMVGGAIAGAFTGGAAFGACGAIGYGLGADNNANESDLYTTIGETAVIGGISGAAAGLWAGWKFDPDRHTREHNEEHNNQNDHHYAAMPRQSV